jgi:hypothetical protein
MFNFVLNASLIHRVRFLGVLSILLTLSLGAGLVKQYADARNTAAAESEGLPAAAAWVNLAKVTAEHRGMSAGLLGGNEDFRAKRDAKQREVDSALEAALRLSQAWSTPRLAEWLRASRASPSPARTASSDTAP